MEKVGQCVYALQPKCTVFGCCNKNCKYAGTAGKKEFAIRREKLIVIASILSGYIFIFAVISFKKHWRNDNT